MFRLVTARRPTLLFDEVDTIFGPAAAQHEGPGDVFNAGHRRGAVAYRCVGEPSNMKVQAFPAFAAVALAGIGDLPDTLDRPVSARSGCVGRAPDEHVEPFSAAARGTSRRGGVPTAWPSGRPRLATSWPMPSRPCRAGVGGPPRGLLGSPARHRRRGRRGWLASPGPPVSGGHHRGTAERRPLLGVRLLGDVHSVFLTSDTDRMTSADLARRLTELEEGPWGDLRGKVLDARGLAQRLRRYAIRPHNVRVGEHQAKGYEWSDSWTPGGAICLCRRMSRPKRPSRP